MKRLFILFYLVLGVNTYHLAYGAGTLIEDSLLGSFSRLHLGSENVISQDSELKEHERALEEGKSFPVEQQVLKAMEEDDRNSLYRLYDESKTIVK
jgi:hypothetical protein